MIIKIKLNVRNIHILVILKITIYNQTTSTMKIKICVKKFPLSDILRSVLHEFSCSLLHHICCILMSANKLNLVKINNERFYFRFKQSIFYQEYVCN